MQLADPIASHGFCEPRIALQMLLELVRLECRAVERNHVRGETSKTADQRNLSGNDIHDETELGFSRKCEGILRLLFDLTERLSRGEGVCDQVGKAVGRKRKVAGVLCSIERASHEGTAGWKMLHPGSNVTAEGLVGARPETILLFGQFQADLAEAISRLIVPEQLP